MVCFFTQFCISGIVFIFKKTFSIFGNFLMKSLGNPSIFPDVSQFTKLQRAISAILKLFFIMYKLFSEIFFSKHINLRVNSFLKNSYVLLSLLLVFHLFQHLKLTQLYL